ncbi:MAG TPA: WD40 repeat domain-containing serine/threonine protein kinase [Terriglobales bacterium]|nr:WD40 repeat domain-containing serine/threonine protein kinase [Terriglobales bacterium]
MALASGMKLGPYEIQSLLGAGGMGEVYRAHDSRLNRTVAIKVLPASFSADRDRLQRFAQEARAAAALNHPNILSIFDIGEEQGAPYVVSELLEGETLRERLRNGPLPIRRVVDYSLQVARGLAAAHDKGIVHRDLKPENLFLTSDNRVKILDFGLAKLTGPEINSDSGDAPTMQVATEAGVVMGTAGYMSPEQVRGKPADHRSDLFSFGAILYEMISGKRAFHGETPADTMSAILKEEAPELSETARNVPPGLERIVRHCLEKHPAQRFQSAGDLAFDLEALTNVSAATKSGAQAAVQQASVGSSRRWLAAAAAVIVLAAAMLGLGWWLGRGKGAPPLAEYKQITFRTGFIGNARYTPDGGIVYSASWDGGDFQLYLARTDDTVSRELGLKHAELLAISKRGELAVRLNTVFLAGYARIGTLARVPLGGGTPREVLENVQDADWSAGGDNMAVVRFVPENSHWRLEYPIGHVLLDSINWLSHPKISSDGRWIAFADHENPAGDDQGSIAVVDMQGHEKKLSSGWISAQGIVWSPKGDEIWFTSSDTGSAQNLRGVTLAGKLRTITNVPGGMWLQDIRNGMPLILTDQKRIGLRGVSPGGKEERELGWLGWAIPSDISRDGKKVLFEEEADGGGPNYTVFLRDTDGSPPVRIGEGRGLAISPDSKWVITKPAKGGPLSVVPTGAGEARQLTHDNVDYTAARYLPDGKQLLAGGIEAGHGARDYLIDLSNGNAKPITPEGVEGTLLSPDGHSVVVVGPDGGWGIWPLEGGGLRPLPGIDSRYYVTGWAPDGVSVYVGESHSHERTVKIFRANVTTGKMDVWKTFGDSLPTGANAGSMLFSSDGSAYVYLYDQILSQAYVVKGLK